MLLRPKARTFRSTLLRAVVPRLVVFGAGALVLIVGHTVAADPTVPSILVPAERVAGVAPSWTAADAAAHPECTPSATWPAGRPAGHLVVQGVRDGSHRKVTFDRAWRLNHNATAVDDLWVLGMCG